MESLQKVPLTDDPCSGLKLRWRERSLVRDDAGAGGGPLHAAAPKGAAPVLSDRSNRAHPIRWQRPIHLSAMTCSLNNVFRGTTLRWSSTRRYLQFISRQKQPEESEEFVVVTNRSRE
jgi:hypothetical protein